MKTIHKSFLLSLIINFAALYAIPALTATNNKNIKSAEPVSIIFINSAPVKAAPVHKLARALNNKRATITRAVIKKKPAAKKTLLKAMQAEAPQPRQPPVKVDPVAKEAKRAKAAPPIEHAPKKTLADEPRLNETLTALALAQVNSILNNKSEPVSLRVSLPVPQDTGKDSELRLRQLARAQVSAILSHKSAPRLNRPHLMEPLATKYPKRARRMNKEGMVRLKVLINTEGNVIDAEVIKSAGYGFDEAALDAVRKAKFIPAMTGKGPVTAKITIPIKFTLQ